MSSSLLLKSNMVALTEAVIALTEAVIALTEAVIALTEAVIALTEAVIALTEAIRYKFNTLVTFLYQRQINSNSPAHFEIDNQFTSSQFT
jgi:hypothetical protein